MRRKDGKYIWFETSINKIKGIDSKESQVLAIARNITERKLLEQNLLESNKILHELSTKDGLTGVWNRRAFDESMNKEWINALNSEKSLSLILFDIDFFKNFNDIYGHQKGDESLRKVANTVNQSMKRNSDRIYRYGGEEFTVILPGTDREGAKVVAEKIRKAVIELGILHIGSQVENFITISVGVATTVPTSQQTLDDFIEKADKALYKAKKRGRNQIALFEE